MDWSLIVAGIVSAHNKKSHAQRPFSGRAAVILLQKNHPPKNSKTPKPWISKTKFYVLKRKPVPCRMLYNCPHAAVSRLQHLFCSPGGLSASQVMKVPQAAPDLVDAVTQIH